MKRYFVSAIPDDYTLPENNVGVVHAATVGEWFHDLYGKVVLSTMHFESFVNNFKNGLRNLMADYNHGSAKNRTPEEGVASGWLKDIYRDGDNFFCLVEWTKKAAEYIRNREYRFISIEYDDDYRDKKTGKKLGPTLVAIALCNRPFLEGLEPVTLSEGPIFMPNESTNSSEGGEKTMKLTKANESKIRKALKLSDGAEITEDHINQVLAIETPAIPDGVVTAARTRLKLADTEQITADVVVKAINAPVEKGNVQLTETQYSALQVQAEEGSQALKMLNERDAKDMIRDAVGAHKMTPAEAKSDWAQNYALTDPKGFKAMVEARPVLDERLFTEIGSGADDDTADADKVRTFIDQLVSDGKKSLAEAQRDALRKFGPKSFAAYRRAV